jgi:hypothetical protein
MKQEGVKWLSRSLLVFAVACVFFYIGKLSSTEWLISAGSYLGYNLFSKFSDVLPSLKKG